MVIIPPRHYVAIENPVVKKNGVEDPLAVETDATGQVKLRHGDQEVRFSQDPFPLFPGEKIVGNIQPLAIVEENTALRLRAKRDFADRYAKGARNEQGLHRRAGDEWMYKGLATYYPQAEVEIVQLVKGIVLRPNQALRIKANDDCVDYSNTNRKAGEEWLVKIEGAYLPGVNEKVIGTIDAITLTDRIALHLTAVKSFKDQFGKDHKAGEEYMVTRETCESFIPDVNENITRTVNATVLNHRQYCVIRDPVGEDGKPQLGTRKLIKGPVTFFLKPGEAIEDNVVKNVFVLSADEALWVRAKESFKDGSTTRRPGDRWLVYGPGEYWPPLEVEVLPGVRAFIRLEALNLYFFQPMIFAFTVVSLLLFYIFYKLYLVPTLFGVAKDEL